MPRPATYPIRLTFQCARGCTLRLLTSSLADLMRTTCDCGAPLLDDFDAVLVRPCCGALAGEECRSHCPRNRRGAA